MQIYIRAGYAWRVANDKYPYSTMGVAGRCSHQADFVIEHKDGIFTVTKSRLDKDLKNAVAFTYSDMIDAINMVYKGDCALDLFRESMDIPAYRAGKIVASYTFAHVDEVDVLVNEIMKRNSR